MKLTLIKPNIGRREHSLYVDEARMEPLQLGILAALTPEDVEVVMYDDRMEEIPYDEPTDLVAITVETFTARRAYEISEEFRKRGVKTVMGGMHAMLISEEVAEHCDCVMVGDAEPVWKEMIEDCRAGRLKNRYDAVQPECPQMNVITRRDIFEGKGYLPITLLQFSRGCNHSCSFCASSVYFKARHYCRPVEDVIAEIKSQKRKLLFFVDDNIVCNREKAKELFRALIPLKIHWVSQGSMDMLQDPELMELMVKSGCLGLVIGFESISPDCISEMHKYTNKKGSGNMYESEIEQLRQWGLQTWAAFTVGHDGDTLESIRATCDFAIRNKFTFAAFNILMPYPNTPLYRKMEQEGRLLYGGKWWLHEDYRFNYCSIVPKNMTPDELTEISFDCRRRFNSPMSIVKRALEPRTNLRTPYRFGTYLIYNPLFRKEVFKKQGMKFGLK
ncbi:MAG: B12-binding domain-containing radical SAM protein [Lachnospiraceae bacterium]|nr:B12-binding domain-containing radical SAM protein [Lachnospiraceae bacterium]MBP3507464.1 B12-binding domain-containing radical SAM protein [Lachnospiraceae bacterium]